MDEREIKERKGKIIEVNVEGGTDIRGSESL